MRKHYQNTVDEENIAKRDISPISPKSSLQGDFEGRKDEYKGITSERQLIIKDFYDRLKPDYDRYQAMKGKKTRLTARAVAVKVGHLDMAGLCYLMSVCKDSEDFSHEFWKKLYVKKDENT